MTADGKESELSPVFTTNEDGISPLDHSGLVLQYPACPTVDPSGESVTVVRRNVWFRVSSNHLFEQAGVIPHNIDDFSFAAGPTWFDFDKWNAGS